MDRLLDQARTGPLYLARPKIVSLMVEAILEGRDTLGHYSSTGSGTIAATEGDHGTGTAPEDYPWSGAGLKPGCG